MADKFGRWKVCPICKEYGFEYEVLDPDYDGDDWLDAHIFRAYSHEEAATKYASDDSSYGDGPREMNLRVREQGQTESQYFSITWEATIVFQAHEATDPLTPKQEPEEDTTDETD